MKVWESKQVIGFSLTWRLLWRQLQQQTTNKYIILSCYIGVLLLLASLKCVLEDFQENGTTF